MVTRNSQTYAGGGSGVCGSGSAVAPATSGSNGPVEVNGAVQQKSSARKMVERESPEMVEFKGHGDVLEGKLISAVKVQITDRKTQKKKEVMEYTLVGDDGKARKCLGSYDLDTKIRPFEDVGFWLQIIYATDKDVPSGKMRVFKVSVEERTAFSDGTEIADEDIPF